MRQLERMSPLGRSRSRWENTIKMHVKGMEWGCVDCIDLNQDWVKWRVLVKAVVDVWIYKTPGIS
jgi:hypothetical protein